MLRGQNKNLNQVEKSNSLQKKRAKIIFTRLGIWRISFTLQHKTSIKNHNCYFRELFSFDLASFNAILQDDVL